MSDPLFRLENIRYAYPGPDPSFALELDSLRVGRGDILALVGPNGAGKTTLLMLLAILARAGRGRLEFLGGDPWANEDSVVRARRDAVLVTHHPYLFKGTVADNVSFGLKMRTVPKTDWTERIRSALALVELEGWERRPVSGLSAGQAQRIALARALALKPRVLLLDEPTANIDAGLGLRLEAVLREVSRESGTTVVFSTHNFSQASRLADAILYLSDGRRVEFSHENCFSGTAATDGRQSWIEPRPGVRICFPGETHGHVTCVINPADIRLFAADDTAAPSPGRNVFSGRVTRMETTDAAIALVRASGSLTFRVALPVAELEAKGISLSRDVLLRFEPESVEVVGPNAPGNSHD
ncbi:MAG: ATP-binding cassette domain-containing protein [Candidatus Aminicenantes bacterium]|nr:ATP-binding cassette domain-containing protein [Candidatus Aminicenantes bacterium]